MDNCRYHYYGSAGKEVWHLSCNSRPNLIFWYQSKLIENSDLVWCQGIKGGVRLVHYNWKTMDKRKYGYISRNSKAMQEFMWIKLQAKKLGVNI